MTEAAFLNHYRDVMNELRLMERQLSQSGSTGRPAGAGAVCYDRIARGTNDPTSAAIQQQEGLEAAVLALKDDLSALEPRFRSVMCRARNYRERCILRQYYHLGQTDAQVAEVLCVSVRHANRLRSDMLMHLDNMSTAVVACPTTSC